MRKLISDFFEGNSKVEVIGTARNGKDALKKIQDLKPDIVTMDVEMPEMNGLDALKRIMEDYPVPVIMLSSTTVRGAETTLKAMENGAVDFVAKPSGTISLDLHKIKEELVEKVEHVVHIPIAKLKKTNRQKSIPITDSNVSASKKEVPLLKETSPFPNRDNQFVDIPNTKNEWNKSSRKIVLIGTSTGGPRALQEVLSKLPKSIKAPILIVQHMPAGFTKSLAERLNQQSQITVKEAEHGDQLQDGTAYVAPGGYHMNLQKIGVNFEITLNQNEPPRSGHRPAVDVMFESVSRIKDFDKIAVIMTGMGYDGSKGLIELKQNGNVIAIAESAETCIVYGMPKAAVETQLVDEVVDVDDIAQAIMKYLP